MSSARLRSKRQHSRHINKTAGDSPQARRLGDGGQKDQGATVPLRAIHLRWLKECITTRAGGTMPPLLSAHIAGVPRAQAPVLAAVMTPSCSCSAACGGARNRNRNRNRGGAPITITITSTSTMVSMSIAGLGCWSTDPRFFQFLGPSDPLGGCCDQPNCLPNCERAMRAGIAAWCSLSKGLAHFPDKDRPRSNFRYTVAIRGAVFSDPCRLVRPVNEFGRLRSSIVAPRKKR